MCYVLCIMCYIVAVNVKLFKISFFCISEIPYIISLRIKNAVLNAFWFRIKTTTSS